LEEGLYCPRCNIPVEVGLAGCPRCGGRPVPVMVVVVMPFVESGEVAEVPDIYREPVEREGRIDPAQAIGCQMYLSSSSGSARIFTVRKEEFLAHAEEVLPRFVQDILSPLVFYRVPDPGEVMRISQEVEEVPTDLFLRIQEAYEPDYLFLPEIDMYFFRYPRLHTEGRGADAAFAFIHLTAYLLDNRENRIASRGRGFALEALPTEVPVDENLVIPEEQQLELLERTGRRAVRELLRNMKMA